jgi:hypothetical protein
MTTNIRSPAGEYTPSTAAASSSDSAASLVDDGRATINDDPNRLRIRVQQISVETVRHGNMAP